MKRYYVFIAILTIVSVGAVVGQYFTSRGSTHDSQTVSDLSLLQTSADDYATANSRLPATINDIVVKTPPHGFKDRLSHYSYRVTASNTFELCADFETDASSRYSSISTLDDYPGDHKKGHQCFSHKSYAILTPVDKAQSAAINTTTLGSTGLTVCNVKTTAVSFTTGIINAVDTKNSSITIRPGVATGSSTIQGFAWTATTVPPAYDASCAKLTLDTLKAGDSVAVYYPQGSNTAVAIQKQ